MGRHAFGVDDVFGALTLLLAASRCAGRQIRLSSETAVSTHTTQLIQRIHALRVRVSRRDRSSKVGIPDT